MDERSFPEPEAFWVGGARESAVVVQPEGHTGSLRLLLRNAPIANQVTLESGTWRQAFDFGPGEEREVDALVARTRGRDPDLWVIELEDRQGRTLLDEPGLSDG